MKGIACESYGSKEETYIYVPNENGEFETHKKDNLQKSKGNIEGSLRVLFRNFFEVYRIYVQKLYLVFTQIKHPSMTYHTIVYTGLQNRRY